MENNEIMTVAVREDIASPASMEALKNPGAKFMCTIEDDGSREAKVAIYNAINAKGISLAEQKGKVLEIVNMAAHPVNLLDENTGEVVEALRVILIDKDGQNFDAVSQGILSSLERVLAIVGPAPYNHPLKMMVVEQKTRKGRTTNTIELV